MRRDEVGSTRWGWRRTMGWRNALSARPALPLVRFSPAHRHRPRLTRPRAKGVCLKEEKPKSKLDVPRSVAGMLWWSLVALTAYVDKTQGPFDQRPNTDTEVRSQDELLSLNTLLRCKGMLITQFPSCGVPPTRQRELGNALKV